MQIAEEGVRRLIPMDTHFKARATHCASILTDCILALLVRNEPADRFLASLFRSDRRMGSRDRRQISNTIFSYFRWRGWLEKTGLEKNSAILGALAAEGAAPDFAAFWCEENGIPAEDYFEILKNPTPGMRFETFLNRIGKKNSVFSDADVLPEWSLSLMPESVRCRALEFQTRPPVWIRSREPMAEPLMDPLKNYGYEPVLHERVAAALKISDAKGNLNTIPEFQDGLFELQDLSSQCIGLACMARPGERWRDLCAGGGGKTLQLAAEMRNQGTVVSSDIRANKLLELKKRAARSGLEGIRFSVRDARSGPEDGDERFDGVLVDAPCSSSGRWRRNPDGRWTASPEKLKELCSLQDAILNAAPGWVAPGGVLVYATCSLFESENETRIRDFLSSHSDFVLEPFPNPLTGEETDGMLRISPWDADCDASFAARLRRLK